MTEPVSDERMIGYLAHCLAIIDEHGWMIQGVFGDTETPSFAYTVGLSHPSGPERAWAPHPELVVIGLSFDVAKYLLNQFGTMVRNGRSLSPGERFPGLLGGEGEFEVTLIEVTDDSDHPLNMVRQLYGYVDRILQIVYPDFSGRYPWEDGYDIDPRVQPLMGPR